MADLLRPAALTALQRWREVLAGAALAFLALWLMAATFGVLRWVAGALLVLAMALIWTAAQRLRFGPGGGGAGVVQVDERRVTYWGPLAGGVVDLDDLRRLDLDPGARPAHWLLTGPGGAVLAIPVDAAGADALLDLFAALPGLGVEAMIAARARTGGPPVTLWRAAGAPDLLPPAMRPLPPRFH